MTILVYLTVYVANIMTSDKLHVRVPQQHTLMGGHAP